MRNAVDVSVIIPAFNHAKPLLRAIESVFDQTVLPTEIVVADDASELPVAQTIDSLVHRAPDGVRIVVKQHNQNAGAAAARNTAIEEAKSDFLAFLDADDTWMPIKLEHQLPALKRALASAQGPIASVTGFDLRGAYAVKSQPDRLGLIPQPAKTLKDFASGCWFCPGSTLVVHRSFFDVVGRYDETLRRFEDYELFLRAGRKGTHLEVTPQALATINSIPSRNETPPQESIQSIMDRHALAMRATDPAAYRRMKAYLSLERAATCYRQKKYLASMAEFIRSQWHHRRPSLHVIKRWQDQSDPLENKTA